MANKKKVIKILGKSGINYTLDAASSDIKIESKNEDVSNVDSNAEKDVLKKRNINSKKLKIRYKNRIMGDKINKAIPRCTNSFVSKIELLAGMSFSHINNTQQLIIPYCKSLYSCRMKSLTFLAIILTLNHNIINHISSSNRRSTIL